MTVTESNLGVMSPDVASIIHFPDGLVGCSTWKRFVLLSETDENLPVAVLQNVDEPGVSLMVTDPTLVQPSYTASLSYEERNELGLDAEGTPVLYCTLTIDRDGSITANLLGPLAINARTRLGKQLVLADSQYSACHPVGVVGVD